MSRRYNYNNIMTSPTRTTTTTGGFGSAFNNTQQTVPSLFPTTTTGGFGSAFNNTQQTVPLLFPTSTTGGFGSAFNNTQQTVSHVITTTTTATPTVNSFGTRLYNHNYFEFFTNTTELKIKIYIDNMNSDNYIDKLKDCLKINYSIENYDFVKLVTRVYHMQPIRGHCYRDFSTLKFNDIHDSIGYSIYFFIDNE
jgi:hypothetical protein